MQRDVHARFPECLKQILSHGDTIDKFKPFTQALLLGNEEKRCRLALQLHVDYTRWQYREKPVLGTEPFALADVYAETECGVLPWKTIRERGDRKLGDQTIDPFIDTEECGGRRSLTEVVLSYLAKPDFKEAIVVQGVAGAGKSSFTLHLADDLSRCGLSPIRILLRDWSLERELTDALGHALQSSDLEYMTALGGFDEAYHKPEDVFNGGQILKDTVDFHFPPPTPPAIPPTHTAELVLMC